MSAAVAGRPLEVVSTSRGRKSAPPPVRNSSHQLLTMGGGHDERARFRCPFCQSNLAPKRKRKISTAGWVTFSLLLVFCFPLCIIGLFIKDENHVCRGCGVTLDCRPGLV